MKSAASNRHLPEMNFHKRPGAIVVGLGSYFRKLQAGLNDYLRVVRLFDTRPVEQLALSDEDARRFSRLERDSAKAFSNQEFDCALVLTPPASHLDYCLVLLPTGVPVLIEKPVVVNNQELSLLVQAVQGGAKLYCSDFYADVRATPLLEWFTAKQGPPPANLRVVGSEDLWSDGPYGLGTVYKVEGKLCEAVSYKQELQERRWLLDPAQGGVLLDLMYHFFVLTSRLLAEPFVPEIAVLGICRDDGTISPWKRTSESAETYARIEGSLRGGVPFTFEVSKYKGDTTDRWFKLHCERGSATMTFANPNVLVIQAGAARCQATLVGNYYADVVKLFAQYVNVGTTEPHGLQDAIAAVKAIEAAKELGQ